MHTTTFRRLYTLRWDTTDGEHSITGTSRDIHQQAPHIHQQGHTGTAWNIAVLNPHGWDVTYTFFEHLNPA